MSASFHTGTRTGLVPAPSSRTCAAMHVCCHGDRHDLPWRTCTFNALRVTCAGRCSAEFSKIHCLTPPWPYFQPGLRSWWVQFDNNNTKVGFAAGSEVMIMLHVITIPSVVVAQGIVFCQHCVLSPLCLVSILSCHRVAQPLGMFLPSNLW